MNKITVYNGPETAFSQIFPPIDGITTLTEFVHMVDSQTRVHKLTSPDNPSQTGIERIKIDILIAYSDEYTGVNEHFIFNFLNYLALHEVDELFLHNPPVQILNQIHRGFTGEVVFDSFKYKQFDEQIVQRMKTTFNATIIGQEMARDQLLSVLYPLVRHSFKKPVVILLFGPSGVGKTETAKFVSAFFGNLLRKQLSMYQTDSFASYLFGENTSRGSFAKDLLDRESNIILLDEFDKANPVFHSAFYQMFDEGVFVDKNYTVSLENSLIFCTSNYKSEQEIRDKLGDAIFSRFDGVIKLQPLSTESKQKIITIEFDKQLQLFSPREQELIMQEEIQERLLSLASRFRNARHIEKVVRQSMTWPLIREL